MPAKGNLCLLRLNFKATIGVEFQAKTHQALIWDIAGQESGEQVVNHVYSSPDGQRLASASPCRGCVPDRVSCKSLYSMFPVSHRLHTYLVPNIMVIMSLF